MRTSYHARARIVQRDESANCHSDAKRLAKIAFRSGDTIDKYQKYPKFFAYLSKRRRESQTCRVRIYRENIYIWKGNQRTLITVHPIPDIFVKEMEEVDLKCSSS